MCLSISSKLSKMGFLKDVHVRTTSVIFDWLITVEKINEGGVLFWNIFLFLRNHIRVEVTIFELQWLTNETNLLSVSSFYFKPSYVTHKEVSLTKKNFAEPSPYKSNLVTCFVKLELKVLLDKIRLFHRLQWPFAQDIRKISRRWHRLLFFLLNHKNRERRAFNWGTKLETWQMQCTLGLFLSLFQCYIVVYFSQPLGAAHSKGWSFSGNKTLDQRFGANLKNLSFC